jgi:hypothetical protein
MPKGPKKGKLTVKKRNLRKLSVSEVKKARGGNEEPPPDEDVSVGRGGTWIRCLTVTG